MNRKPRNWAEAREMAHRNLKETTPEEDAAITEDARSDPDDLPLTEDDEFVDPDDPRVSPQARAAAKKHDLKVLVRKGGNAERLR